jgi:hypothetical protein
LHGTRRAFTIRGRGCHVIRVSRKAVSGEFTVDFRAAGFGMFQFLHHNDSCAFANHKTVAITIERAGGTLGFVVSGAERSHS